MKLIMWDWDGTLVDTMPDHAKLAARCMNSSFGMETSKAKEEYLNTTGIPFEKQLEKIFPDAGKRRILACAKKYHEEKMIDVYKNPKDFPEAIEVMKWINSKGFCQVISSSTKELIIREWMINHKINLEVLGKESGSKKDHIQNLKGIFKNVFSEVEIIFVSDSYGDMSLPATTLGVDVPKDKENIFRDYGAKHVSFHPVSFKWLEEVKSYLV